MSCIISERENVALTETLFAEFETATHDDWLEAARESLRGRSLDSLVSSTYEGIDIQPLIGADAVGENERADSLPGQYPFRRGETAAGYRARPWLIAQEIDIAEPEEFNAALREALANGQTAIVLGEALELISADDLRRALAEIDLGRTPLFIRSDRRAREIYHLLRTALTPEGLDQLSGCVGCDPLADLARTGLMPKDAFKRMATHVMDVAEYSPQLGSIAVSTNVYHDAGANAVQELAIALATAVEYLRMLDERGSDLDVVAGKLRFELGIGENFFMQVAKFRAAKSLWAQATRAIGIDSGGQRIRLHACSGSRNKTRRDRHVNLLRLTTEALAAAIGGVDSLTIAPFDAPLCHSDGFSRRLSRNMQLILQDEVELIQLIDPAGGAWHVELLTDELARRAWKQFQAIEAAGGMLAALQSGAIQAEIEAMAERRRRDVASGAAILVGVNRYVNPDEATPEIRPLTKPEALDAAGEPTVSATPLVPLRLEDACELPPESGKGA